MLLMLASRLYRNDEAEGLRTPSSPQLDERGATCSLHNRPCYIRHKHDVAASLSRGLYAMSDSDRILIRGTWHTLAGAQCRSRSAMSAASNLSAIVATRVGSGVDAAYLPNCTKGVSFRDFITGSAQTYAPGDWDFYKVGHLF
jgi:hypothetical protein